jgi:light-regulated signal transduction histidine kinase (bacteriophytochrome)
MHNATQYTLLSHKDHRTDLPPIRVTVSANKTDVFFRVSDQAGGILSSKYERLWSCQERANHGDFADLQHIPKMPVTLAERLKRQQTINDDTQPGKMATADHPEIRGLGIGLIMSRVYAEYWGGELQVISMDGYGTDAYVRIPRNGSTAENLGIINTPLMEQTHGRHHHLALKKNPVIHQTVPADKPTSRMIMHSDIFHNQKGWLPSTVVPS